LKEALKNIGENANSTDHIYFIDFEPVVLNGELRADWKKPVLDDFLNF